MTPLPGDAVVELRDVDFSYPRATRPALAGVSLAVAPGEVVVVAGESGSGKSTLARLIVGLLRATTGTVRIGGMDPSSAPRDAVAACAGLVFQDPNHQLFASTVRDELALGPRHIGVAEEEVAARAVAAAEQLGLASELDSHPYRLGISARKRVALAAILVMQPQVLVVDEPTTGQARRETTRTASLLHDLAGRGTALIVVTHDLSFAAEVATRVVVLREGRVQADGPVRDVLGDEPLLDAAGLEAPQIVRLAARVGVARADGAPLSVGEVHELLVAGGLIDGPGQVLA